MSEQISVQDYRNALDQIEQLEDELKSIDTMLSYESSLQIDSLTLAKRAISIKKELKELQKIISQ